MSPKVLNIVQAATELVAHWKVTVPEATRRSPVLHTDVLMAKLVEAVEAFENIPCSVPRFTDDEIAYLRKYMAIAFDRSTAVEDPETSRKSEK